MRQDNQCSHLNSQSSVIHLKQNQRCNIDKRKYLFLEVKLLSKDSLTRSYHTQVKKTNIRA